MSVLERETMLTQLDACMSRAWAGNGCNVIVSGEAGIGKSTLLREFTKRADKQTRVLWGICDALSTPRPLGPLQDVAAVLGDRMEKLIHERHDHATLFAALLKVIEDSNTVTVFIIEDLHWADAATLDLVRYLGRRMPFLKAMMVMSIRSEEMRASHPLVRAVSELPPGETLRLELPPLSASAVAQLAGVPEAQAVQLHTVTRGNPFFVTELANSGSLDGAHLPPSVRDAVWARLQRLAAAERQVVELLSLVPGSVEPWLLQALRGEQALALAENCCEIGILQRSVHGDLMFRHELARLATLELVPDSRRRASHHEILNAMQAHAGVPLSRIAHHAVAWGNPAAVLKLVPQAAREAAALGAHAQAAGHLAVALKFVEQQADVLLQAQLLEDWSYEAGLSQALDDEVIAARRKAVELWRKLGRRDKVGLNLRWLSRLYWYRGQSAQADEYLTEAVSELEATGPGPELAMAYSTRSQFHMLHDRMPEAVEWGMRAIELATKVGADETRAHALNNVGSAMLFIGDDAGKTFMEESLEISLRLGFHEQAARAYTNYSEYAVVSKQFALAEKLLNEGIAFDTEHDLESWTYYLIGRQAQLRLEQGRLAEARAISESVLARDGQTMLMKMPARLMLARALLRLGEDDADKHIAQAASDAASIGEQQYISSVLLLQVERGWLKGDHLGAREPLRQISKLRLDTFDPWERGEFFVWWQRMMPVNEQVGAAGPVAPPRQLELEGDAIGAAEVWLKLDVPYEAAISLMHDRKGTVASLTRAYELLSDLGASPGALLAKSSLEKLGKGIARPARKRGPYSSARSNPMGLTAKEAEILDLITAGKTNQEIAETLDRSQRTVEHHVSAVLAKFGARTRLDLVLRLRQEPWLLAEKSPALRNMGLGTDVRRPHQA